MNQNASWLVRNVIQIIPYYKQGTLLFVITVTCRRYLYESFELLLVSIESSFVTLRSRWSRVGWVPFHPVLHYEYFMSWPRILGTILPDCYHLSRLLTGYSNLDDLWNNDLPSVSQVVLNGPILWVLWRTVGTRNVTSALSRHSDVHGWFRTAHDWGLAVGVPHKQMYSKCDVWLTVHRNSVWIRKTN